MAEEQQNFDFDGHVRHLEDAKSVDLPADDQTLTDSELEAAGLIKTSAYVRTRRSKNALRIEKHREAKQSEGIKQLNIEVPEQHRDALKAAAKRLCAGESVDEVLSTPKQTDLAPDLIESAKKVASIKAAGGVRRLLLKIAGVI